MEELCTEMLLKIAFYLHDKDIKSLYSCTRRFRSVFMVQVWNAPRLKRNLNLNNILDFPIQVLHSKDISEENASHLLSIKTLKTYILDGYSTARQLRHLQNVKFELILHTNTLQAPFEAPLQTIVKLLKDVKLIMDHKSSKLWQMDDLRLFKDITFLKFNFDGMVVQEWEMAEFIQLLKHLSPVRINAGTELIIPCIEFAPKDILTLQGLNFIAFSTAYLKEHTVHPWAEFNYISLKCLHIERGEYISMKKLNNFTFQGAVTRVNGYFFCIHTNNAFNLIKFLTEQKCLMYISADLFLTIQILYLQIDLTNIYFEDLKHIQL